MRVSYFNETPSYIVETAAAVLTGFDEEKLQCGPVLHPRKLDLLQL